MVLHSPLSYLIVMELKKTRILILVILVALASPAIAEDKDDLLAPYKGTPAYCLIIDAASPAIDRGDEFDIKFYISGAGDVDLSEISITIPPELLAKDKNVTYSYISGVTEDPDKHEIKNVKHNKTEDNKSRRHFQLPTTLYKRYFRPDRGDIPQEEQLPILAGEMDYEKQPAFSVNFTIADNAPAGDYTITINHYYTYSDKWYLDKNELKIHVNAWYETGIFGYSHMSWYSLGIILAVFAVIATFIIQFHTIYIKFGWKWAVIIVSSILLLLYSSVRF